MEKLQAAIEKARSQRSDRVTARSTGRQAPTAAAGAWMTLPSMQVDAKALLRNRIFLDGSAREAVAIDILRTKILQLCRENNWRRVVVTSPTKGCGKTTTCANLAASFARQSDRRAIIIDMDLRRPSLAQKMGQAQDTSFHTVLEDKARFAEQTRLLAPNVAISANHSAAQHPSKLIMSDRTTEIINEIDAEYQPDIMLFDVPPVLITDDTLAFVRNADCAMIIAGAEKSTLDEVDQCEKELAEHIEVLGTVLNMCAFATESYGYEYGY